MKRIVVMALAVLACSSAAWAQSNAAAEQRIMANEQKINDAVAKKDLKTFHAMVDPNGWGVDMMGLTKVADMDKMIQGGTITEQKLDQMKVMWISPTVAVLTYRWTGKGTFGGQPAPSPTYASTVYSKDNNGEWIARFHQESMAAPPAAAAPSKK
jgi:ketosteroid isomerase-like protein